MSSRSILYDILGLASIVLVASCNAAPASVPAPAESATTVAIGATATTATLPTSTLTDSTPTAPADTAIAATTTPVDTTTAVATDIPVEATSTSLPATAVPSATSAAVAPTSAPLTPASPTSAAVAPTALPVATVVPPTPVPTTVPPPTTAPVTPTSPPVALSAKPTGGGTLAGVVTDTAGRPIAGAIVTVGFKTFKLVGQSDGSGRYRVTGIPNTAGTEVFSFAPGYVYDHSGGFPIPTGRVTSFNVKLAADPNRALDPVISSVSASPDVVARGSTVSFTIALQSTQTMSDEVIAASGSLGRSALFVPIGGGRYQATFTVPSDIPPGAYGFTMFGATEQCEENARFPSVQVTVT